MPGASMRSFLRPARKRRTIPLPTSAGRLARGSDAEQGVDIVHNTIKNGVIEHVAKWRQLLAAQGRGVSVYNPKSLLAEQVPFYPPRREAVD